MDEKALSKQVMRYLKDIPDLFAFRVETGPFGRRGISDILICYQGDFIAIELKVGRNKPTKLQTRFQDFIRSTGGKAFVCRSLEEVIECLKPL